MNGEIFMKTVNCIFRKHWSALLAGFILIFVGLGCDSTSDEDWKRELGGKKLSMAKTSGSISDRVEIWFCTSGEYAMKTQFSGFSAGGGGTLSMADEDLEGGMWRVVSSTLILQSQEGKTREYSISQGTGEDVIYLNDNGYLVSRHNECP